MLLRCLQGAMHASVGWQGGAGKAGHHVRAQSQLGDSQHVAAARNIMCTQSPGIAQRVLSAHFIFMKKLDLVLIVPPNSDLEDYYKKADPKPLIFCNFALGNGDRKYAEVTDFKRLSRTLTEVGILSL